MGKYRYGNINELISEIEALGDWRDVSQRSNFLKVLSKIAMIHQGYKIENENGEIIKGYYPQEVTNAIVEACKSKFPSDRREAFDEENNLKEGYPEYSDLLCLVKDGLSISFLVERTRISQIAEDEFGINVYDRTATREGVDGLISSSKEYLEKVKEDTKNENELLESTKDMRSKLLHGMSMTQSWLTLEDLQTVLPPEQYQELVTTVRNGLEQYYAKLNLPDVKREKIEKEIAEEVNGKAFEIGVDDKGGFILQEFELSTDKLTRPIDLSQLDETKLASVVEKAMQKHLNYGRFHANKHLDTKQIPETLEYYINIAKQCQSRNIETPEVSTERQAEEKEIADLAAEKAKLTSEIGDIESELEALRAKEAELKKALYEKKAELNGLEEK